MLKSMTAFGRSCNVTPFGRFVVEIQSVNRKFLEINTFIPKEFIRFDSEIKKWISPQVVRGQINVRIIITFENSSPLIVIPNLPLARQIKSAWDKITKDLGLENQKFDIHLLANETGILLYDEEFQDETQYRTILEETVKSALTQLQEMKSFEGKILQSDIETRFKLIETHIQKVELKAPHATEKYRQKLIERLKEVIPGNFENEERILREIALYAEKIDIAEEIIRFHSHLKQCKLILNSSSKDAIGKKMEFVLQELSREVNTIGSKASDIDVSYLVIEIKSELERIREQIQNVE
jgi:uncharacterized protein (TIGR00255 family)